jgi:hypothetical protein
VPPPDVPPLDVPPFDVPPFDVPPFDVPPFDVPLDPPPLGALASLVPSERNELSPEHPAATKQSEHQMTRLRPPCSMGEW